MNPASSTLPLLEAMQIYFQGEKIEALVFILPVGLLSIVFGAWLWSDGGPGFARGVAIPFLAMGLLMTTVGAVVGYRTPDQVERLHMGLQQAPQATAAAESKRMAKVDAAWKYYLVLWAAFGVIGLALRFLSAQASLQGLGMALVFHAGVGLMVDGFAERRTHPYMAALAALAPHGTAAAETARR